MKKRLTHRPRLAVFVPLMLTLSILTGCGGSPTVPSGIEGEPITPVQGDVTISSPERDASHSTEEGQSSNQIEQDSEEESMTVATPSGAVPGLHTLENFLRTAMLPVGNTMYVWGGGWNEEDTGAGIEAVTIGLSENWKDFSSRQAASYDYKDTRYQIHDGLDCSGFVGWAVYNTMEDISGKEGYVLKSTDTAQTYARNGFGDFISTGQVTQWLPGDIASMKGHVWICLGTCGDGSVLLLHSSPPGVRLCGTSANNTASDAVRLAEDYMRAHYPDWSTRYPDCLVSDSYLQKSGVMRWNTETFPDAQEIQSLSPEELLETLR